MKYKVVGKNTLGEYETVYVSSSSPQMALWVVIGCSPQLDPFSLNITPYLEPIDETNVIRVDFQLRKRI